jgi:hypothetical protein
MYASSKIADYEASLFTIVVVKERQSVITSTKINTKSELRLFSLSVILNVYLLLTGRRIDLAGSSVIFLILHVSALYP